MINPPLFNYDENSPLAFHKWFLVDINKARLITIHFYTVHFEKVYSYHRSAAVLNEKNNSYRINELVQLPFKKIKSHLPAYHSEDFIENAIFLMYTLYHFRSLGPFPLDFKKEPYYIFYAVITQHFGFEVSILTAEQYKSNPLGGHKEQHHKIYVRRKVLHIE